MAEIRKIPFGYTMENGEICVSSEESTAVKKIYDLYILGESYQKIAERLNGQSVKYTAEKAWNKGTVSRILSDSRYLGDELPAIISKEKYDAVQNKLGKKQSETKVDDITYALSRICCCGECGEDIKRKHHYEYWSCTNCGQTKIRESEVSTRVINIVEKIIANPNLLQKLMTPQFQTEFVLPKKSNEQEKIKTIMKITAEQYRKIGNSGYETERLKRKFTNMENQQITVEIIKDTVSKVLIQTDSKIAIQLKNSQIFREETG